mmetsp:Transcript_6946/g.8327  ORF Transcript_6946/g.8327 Transcript_6946/m.8327 type:complete len:188 (+) Transcript_6946:67-630(+)
MMNQVDDDDDSIEYEVTRSSYFLNDSNICVHGDNIVVTPRSSADSPPLLWRPTQIKQEEGLEFGRWSQAEHARFVEGLQKFGKRKWVRIAEHVGTRSVIQVRSHAQKYFKKLRKAQEDEVRSSCIDHFSTGSSLTEENDAVTTDGFSLLFVAASIVESSPLFPHAQNQINDDSLWHKRPRLEQQQLI